MGAFLAGVLLSESTFRHQLEADIEPFRGILLGLFFLGVGMSLDLAVVAARLAARSARRAGAYGGQGAGHLRRRAPDPGRATARRSTARALMAQGGEFAFVLYAAARAARRDRRRSANAIMTRHRHPLDGADAAGRDRARRLMPPAADSLDGVDAADGLHGSVLIIGFGRFGQVVSQPLLARGVDVIDHRHRRRDDPRRRQFRLQGLLRRRHAARRAARLGRRRAPRRSWSASTTGRRRPHRRARARPNSRRPSCSCAPSTAATRCG